MTLSFIFELRLLEAKVVSSGRQKSIREVSFLIRQLNMVMTVYSLIEIHCLMVKQTLFLIIVPPSAICDVVE